MLALAVLDKAAAILHRAILRPKAWHGRNRTRLLTKAQRLNAATRGSVVTVVSDSETDGAAAVGRAVRSKHDFLNDATCPISRRTERRNQTGVFVGQGRILAIKREERAWVSVRVPRKLDSRMTSPFRPQDKTLSAPSGTTRHWEPP